MPLIHRLREGLYGAYRRLPSAFHPSSSSLERHLVLWLLLPQLVLWAAAGYFTYNLASRYVNRATDRSLYQSSRALARQIKPVGSGLFIDFPKAARDIIETDPDDKVYYMVSSPPGAFILGNHKLPPPPSNHAKPLLDQPYFYDGAIDKVPVRVAALYVQYGEKDEPQLMLVQLAKSRTSREELAANILSDAALPLSGLVLLMSLIVWTGIRAGLAPLIRLRDAVKDREPNDLAPIQIQQAPTEVHALAKALNRLLVAVHENVNVQKRFISDAAHQLRTPLAGLKSQTELALRELKQHPNGSADLSARLERVRESATRSAHLVNQLLTLARAEPESVAMQAPGVFDIRRLARETTAEMVPKALQAKVDLGFDDTWPFTVETASVNGHQFLIREALINLIDNAIRYSGAGTEVTVRVQLTTDHVKIVVEDNGPGITDSEMERVFERFVRGTSDGTGCGLGLPIVKEIIQRHQGTVQLSHHDPKGLKATILLPRI